MADVQILAPGQVSAPLDYLVPGAQEILVKNLSAKFDGSAASVTWQPAITLIAPGGKEIGTFPLTNALAAGASADVSFFPGVRNASSTSPPVTGPIPWPAANQANSKLDSTSWDNVPDGAGKYEALALDGSQAITYFAGGYQGDDFPSLLVTNYVTNEVGPGVYINDGTADPYFGNSTFYTGEQDGAGNMFMLIGSAGAALMGGGIDANSGKPTVVVFGGVTMHRVVGTAGLGMIFYVGHGDPNTHLGGNISDKYWRTDGAAGTYLYTCTLTGIAGVATWAGIL